MTWDLLAESGSIASSLVVNGFPCIRLRLESRLIPQAERVADQGILGDHSAIDAETITVSGVLPL